MMTPRSTLLCAAALMLLCLALSEPAHADERSDGVDALLAEWDRDDAPGCSVAVVQDGEILYSRGFGLANLEHDIPNTPQTIFHVASVSKQFAAFAAALLADGGALSLDDDIRIHIPELHDFGRTITIRHLIHHISGLRDQWDLLVLTGWRMEDVITHDDVMGLLFAQRELNFEPGEQYLYCNSGYTLIAEIVRRVSGKSLRDFCHERIFEPLGMSRTHFHDDHRMIVPGRASCYWEKGDGWQKAVLSYAIVGATSLFTTVEDLARWQTNFETRIVGGDAVHEQMLERLALSSGRQHSYAFGLIHGRLRGIPSIGHSGGDAGFVCHVVRIPQHKLSAIVLANTSSVPAAELARRAAQVYLRLADDSVEPAADAEPPPDEPPPSIVEQMRAAEPSELSREKLEALCGRYASEAIGMSISIALEDGELVVRSSTAPDQPQKVVPVAETAFRVAGGFVISILREPRGGTISKLDVFPPGSDEPVRFDRAPDDDEEAADLSVFAGRYYSDELDVFYDLIAEGGTLFLDRRKYGRSECTPAGPEDSFTANSGLRLRLEFERSADGGEVTGFRVSTARVRHLWFRRVREGVR